MNPCCRNYQFETTQFLPKKLIIVAKSMGFSKNQNHLDKKSALMQVNLQTIGSLDKLKERLWNLIEN